MPNERPPKKPLPDWYTPPQSFTYQLKDTDTWETVASQCQIDVKNLIKFNFHTNVPEEVNWYLKRRTGCKVPSPSGLNWRFSSPAHSNPKAPFPGVIHIPIRGIVVDDAESDEPLDNSNSPEGGIEEKPGEGIEDLFSHHGVHLVHKILEGIEWGEVVATVFELGLPEIFEGAMVFLGPAAAIAALGISLGMGTMEALEKIKTDEALMGLSYGVVLGAGRASNSFLKLHGFLKHPVNNPYFPEQEKNFGRAYKLGLAIGYAFGKKLNAKQRGSLFRKLRAYLGMDFPDFENWSSSDAERYYRGMGPAFRRYILKM